MYKAVHFNLTTYFGVKHYVLKRSKKFSPKNKKDSGMACHTPLLQKVKKQGEMPLPSLGPIPLNNHLRKSWLLLQSCMKKLQARGQKLAKGLEIDLTGNEDI